MSNQLDSASFDDSKLQPEMKQTATFYYPPPALQGSKLMNNSQQRAIAKPPLELTFKPRMELKKVQSNSHNDLLLQQSVGRKNNQLLKNVGKVQVKSAQQIPKNPIPYPVNGKVNSPIKIAKPPSIKPYSPPQPKSVQDSSPLHYNASVVQQSQTNKFSASPNFQQKLQQQEFLKKELNYLSRKQQEESGKKKLHYGKNLTQHKQTEEALEVSMVDCKPSQGGRIYASNKPPLDNVRISSQQDYPSYKKSLLESHRTNQDNIEHSLDIHQQSLLKSNSTTFLPKIDAKFKLQTKLLNPTQIIGYGSVGQSQETALRTSSSKQTISPNNEFINPYQHQQTIEDSLLRKSKTAQESMRDFGVCQLANKFTYKINSYEPQNEQLPQIQSPSSGTQQGFPFGQSKQGKTFLQRKAQAKIISRLFSSKSDQNNNNIN